MSERKVEFLPDGHRIFVSPAEVVRAWRGCTRLIPPQYAVGTAEHETNFTANEVDTEPSGFVSVGIFQLSAQEAREALLPRANLLSVVESCDVLAAIASQRYAAICEAAGLTGAVPDVWAYLALAHNQGLGAALKTIKAHGLHWAAYKERNPQLPGIASYGDACISGGTRWPDVLSAGAAS